MSEDPAGRGLRPDLQPRLRAAALTAVIVGVLLLAAAAFVLSYAGIHQIALAAGVSPGLARLYPLIFDAMLVIAGSAVLAMRAAGWAARAYVWGCLLLLLAGVATGDAVHAMNIALPRQQSRAAVAVTPWALLLLAFGLWLAMLRYLRRARAASGKPRQSTQAGHVRLAPATAAVPRRRALPAGVADPAAQPATGAPAAGGAPASAHSAHPGPDAGGGQADTEDYTDTEDYPEHVVYAEPEIAEAGATGEGDAEPGPQPAGGEAGAGDAEASPQPAGGEAGGGDAEPGPQLAGGEAGHGGEETGQGAGSGASAPTVPAPAPIPQFDRLRSSPTPPQDLGRVS